MWHAGLLKRKTQNQLKHKHLNTASLVNYISSLETIIFSIIFIFPFAYFQNPSGSRWSRRFVVESKKNHLPASNSGVLGVRGGSTDLLETTARSKVPPFFLGEANGDLQLLYGFIVDSRFLFERHFGGFLISNPTISASLLHSGWSNSLLGLVMAILTFAHKSTSQVDLTREEAAIYNTITVSL